jgi:hypothetical protein
VALTIVLGLHVMDLALTDFLSVYNPIVRQAQEPLGWVPQITDRRGEINTMPRSSADGRLRVRASPWTTTTAGEIPAPRPVGARTGVVCTRAASACLNC